MLTRLREFAEVTEFLAVHGTRAAFRRPNRTSEIYRTAWYVKSCRLPAVSIEDLFPGIEKVELSLHSPLLQMGGNVWTNELVILAGICRAVRPKRVFEIGTFNGRTTVNLAANCPEDAVIYTLDIPHDHPAFAMVSGEERFSLKANAGALYRNSPYAGKVRQLWSDSAEFDPAPLAGQIDLAFIDGSHSYAYVENDTRKTMEMMAPGGVVLWHDYYPQYPDVARYLEASNYKLYHIEGTSLVVFRKDARA